jgi:DNA-binding NarL/FixJ family response regulator
MHNDAQVVAEAFRAGGSGYVLKHCAGLELIDAIHAAIHDQTYLSPLVAPDLQFVLGSTIKVA